MQSLEKTNLQNSEHNFINLSDHILENEIFSYLTNKDLFFSLRPISIRLNELVIKSWSLRKQTNLANHDILITVTKEKEELALSYDNKIEKIINYKNRLMHYTNHINIFEILENLIHFLNFVEIKKLFIIFFSFFNLPSAADYLDQNKMHDLRSFLTSEGNSINFRIHLLHLLVIEDDLLDLNYLTEMQGIFIDLRLDLIENIGQNADFLYMFLELMINYQIFKVELKNLKKKIEELLNKLQEVTTVFPILTNFMDRTHKLMFFNKSSNSEIKNIIFLFEQNKITHPLIDYYLESTKSYFELKDFLLKIPELNQNSSEITKDTIFLNIADRRTKLSRKYSILFTFNNFYRMYKIQSEENIIYLNKEEFTIKEFLWCMKISAFIFGEYFSEYSIIKTKKILDKIFDYENHILYDYKKFENTEKNQNNDIVEKDLIEISEKINSEIQKFEILQKLKNISNNEEIKDKNIKSCNQNLLRNKKFLDDYINDKYFPIVKSEDDIPVNLNYTEIKLQNKKLNQEKNDQEILKLKKNSFEDLFEIKNPKFKKEIKEAEEILIKLCDQTKASEDILKFLENSENEIKILMSEKEKLIFKKEKTEEIADNFIKLEEIKKKFYKNKKYYYVISYLLLEKEKEENNHKDKILNFINLINSNKIEDFAIEEDFIRNWQYTKESSDYISYENMEDLFGDTEKYLRKEVNEIYHMNLI